MDQEAASAGNSAEFRRLSHDIRNQLSNITLSLEQLKYELPGPHSEAAFYIETISQSCRQINELLKQADSRSNESV
ncbi:hypothetical protein MUY27_12310 [Mucilaginibacter sp. RS28]|uniref:histidine kinase n=1 Tax=Mucilaginibacter straminoryzae TaxID=2932774 RepID=A0A9X1X3E6_9SPHI|nr:histidine kinase dimerization/phospho-acceptor domain-containing protein [Mucilaginibacter straminoryzae]MCJ8210492.1 hypothetical protein [Mucilaginibacter straminoryzae]